MYLFYFTTAVLLLVAGHFLRTKRWKQIISAYEQLDDEYLIRALAIGYTINFFIPFRMGDFVRAVISGRRMANGKSFSFATIVVEYLLDVPIVGAIFLTLFFLDAKNTNAANTAFLYGIIMGVLLISALLAIRFSGFVKSATKAACYIFNDQIRYSLLFFFYGLLTSFKNIFVSVNKIKVALYSICMWGVYLFSYFCLTHASLLKERSAGFSNIFSVFFSRGGFNLLSLNGFTNFRRYEMDAIIYTAASLVILFILIFALHIFNMSKHAEKTDVKEEKPLHLLPWVNEKDRLNFLESYFSSDLSNNLKKFIEFNRDIHILEDHSAGSNATTMLCMNNENMFYRKYSLGVDADRLFEQVLWIQEHEHMLPLPVILKQQHEDGYCIYDMEYHTNSVNFFNHIHSNSIDSSWEIMQAVLEDLSSNLYRINKRVADKTSVVRYIENKVLANLNRIEAAKELRLLMEYDSIIINGIAYHNMSYLKKWLKRDYLQTIFEEDEYCDIHGDLTVENLICCEKDLQKPYYIIDPNINNTHDSPFLDYGKLLQSLHGNYEFLMRTEKVKIENNQITFLAAESRQYAELYQQYHRYLTEKFTKRQVRSIYFHEIVHWLRLMPYKIEKNGARAAIFFAGMIKIFNDVVEWYGEYEK